MRPSKTTSAVSFFGEKDESLAMHTCICDEKESNATKDIEAPLIRGLDKSAYESSGNHYLVHENGVENGRCGHATGQEKIQ